MVSWSIYLPHSSSSSWGHRRLLPRRSTFWGLMGTCSGRWLDEEIGGEAYWPEISLLVLWRITWSMNQISVYCSWPEVSTKGGGFRLSVTWTQCTLAKAPILLVSPVAPPRLYFPRMDSSDLIRGKLHGKSSQHHFGMVSATATLKRWVGAVRRLGEDLRLLPISRHLLLPRRHCSTCGASSATASKQ